MTSFANFRAHVVESDLSRANRGLASKRAVNSGRDIASELFEAIRAELAEHSGDFTAADAIRLTNLGMVFLRDFTAIDKLTKHRILSGTIGRIVDEVDMPEATRELLKALFQTDLFDGVIHGAVELYNMAQQAVLAKFDLNNDGSVSLQEVHAVCCGPAGCCVPRNSVISPAISGPPTPRLLAAPPTDGCKIRSNRTAR